MAPNELISKLELDGMRADVEQLFTDMGRIIRPTGTPEYDRATDSFIGADTFDIIYEGRATFYPIMSRRDRFDEQGQGLIFIRQYRVMIPWDEAEIQIRDIYQPLTSDDPYIIGRSFEVRDVVGSSIIGYRRLTVHDPKE